MNLVIENYKKLSALTALMRSAAEQGDWDRLVELEQQCSQHVEMMKAQDGNPVDETTRKLKVDLINRILADDAAIREHTLPWMARLQRLINSSRSEQRLQQAYGNKA